MGWRSLDRSERGLVDGNWAVGEIELVPFSALHSINACLISRNRSRIERTGSWS